MSTFSRTVSGANTTGVAPEQLAVPPKARFANSESASGRAKTQYVPGGTFCPKRALPGPSW